MVELTTCGRRRLGMLALLVLVLFPATGSFAGDTEPVAPVAVACSISGQLSEGELDSLLCRPIAGGSSFTSVPSGQTLFVTGVLITPRNFPSTGAGYVAFIHQRGPDNGFLAHRAFSRNSPDQIAFDGAQPLLVLASGEHLAAEQVNPGGTQPVLDVDVFGRLVQKPALIFQDRFESQ